MLSSAAGDAIYRKLQAFSATLLRENKEAIIIGLPWSVASTTVRPWSELELDFLIFLCSVDRGRGQNTTIEGQILSEKAKNLAEHIKQLYPSINRE